MSNWDSIESTIGTWFAAASGLSADKIIFTDSDDRNETRPERPYMTLFMPSKGDSIYSVPQRGMKAQSGGSGLFYIDDIQDFTVLAQVHGSGGAEYLRSAMMAKSNGFLLDTLNQKQITVIDVDTVTIGAIYAVRAWGTTVTYTAILGDDAEAIRDALVIAVNSSDAIADSGVVASNGAAVNQISLTGTEFPIVVDSKLSYETTQNAVDVGIYRTEGVVNIPRQFNKRWNDRHSLDTFWYMKQYYFSDGNPSIDRVTGTLNIGDIEQDFDSNE